MKKIVLLLLVCMFIPIVNAAMFSDSFPDEVTTNANCDTFETVKIINYSSSIFPINFTNIFFEHRTTDTAAINPVKSRLIIHFEDLTTDTTSFKISFDDNYVVEFINNSNFSKFIEAIEFQNCGGSGQVVFSKNHVVNYGRFRFQNFTAINRFNGDPISIFNLTIDNGTTVLFTGQTTNGSIFTNISGDFIVNVTSDSFTTFSQNLTLIIEMPVQINMSPEKSLKIQIFNEETDTLITDENLTVNIVGDTRAFVRNFTTSTGQINITNITLDSYTITYGGGKYRFRTFFIEIRIDNPDIDLFDVVNTSSSLIIFSVIDEKFNPIRNATIKISKFFITRSQSLIVDMGKTDQSGEVASYLVPNDVFYQVNVEKNNTVIFRGEDRKIFSSFVTIAIPLLDDIIESMAAIRDNIFTNLTWNNDTNIVSFFFSDTSNLLREGCLKVIEKTALTETIFGPVCSTAISATVIINMTGLIKDDTLYIAQGQIETNTTFSTYLTDQIDFIKAENFERFGLAGLFFSWIFIISMFFLGLPINFTIAMIYTILSSITIQIIGLSFFGWGMIIGFSLIGILIATVMKK